MSRASQVERHYTASEIADLLGLHPNQIRALFRPGGIWPVVRINSRVVRASARTVNAYLQRQTFDPKGFGPEPGTESEPAVVEGPARSP